MTIDDNESVTNKVTLPELGVAELESKLFVLEKEVEKLSWQNEALLEENERMQRELVEYQSQNRGRLEESRETGKIDKRLEKMQKECKENEDRFYEMQ